MSHTLSASGVYMGEPLNASGDLLPPQAMYEAARMFGKTVTLKSGGDLTWDWDAALAAEVPDAFSALIRTYLTTVLESAAEYKGWKIPETTLVFPWILRMFPQARYILWVRNPRDCILGHHLTDDLADWGVAYPKIDDAAEDAVRRRRAISWKYQYDLVQVTPKPEHWIEVRFEDFVLRQEETLGRLEDFLGFPLARISVNPEAVDRWRLDTRTNTYDFLAPAMAQYGYDGAETSDL
jgi:hypothetical protein